MQQEAKRNYLKFVDEVMMEVVVRMAQDFEQISANPDSLESKYLVLRNMEVATYFIYFVQEKSEINRQLWNLFDGYLARIMKEKAIGSPQNPMLRDMKPVVVKRLVNAVSKRMADLPTSPYLKFQDLNILLMEHCYRLEQQVEIISRDSLPKPDQIQLLISEYADGPSDLVTAT